MTTEPLAARLQERLSDHRFRSGAYWVLSQLALCYPEERLVGALNSESHQTTVT
jgi:hypothetical protein